ncbi:hypothetical protein [Tsukamurella spumae]|uniref:Uncharacterized protein n=1 Tax=Tsukamurella spumae TaxID=44753 RepID=A0A846X538_9ACTN|nr:hypothetical protein [Tsukamurella spumae]NKY20797.1 hypothetical protein [Tsukamurella spumae]
MNDVTVRLRNLLTGEWTRYQPEAWLEDYFAFVEDSLCCWRDTVGGSFGVTGTPEQGRLTVCDIDGEVVRDYDWRAVVADAPASPAGCRWR